MPVDEELIRCSTFYKGKLFVGGIELSSIPDVSLESIKDYFYRVAKENGFDSLMYDSRCKTKEEIDEYIEYLIKMHE